MTLARDLESLAYRSRQFDLACEAAMRRDDTAFREAMDKFRRTKPPSEESKRD